MGNTKFDITVPDQKNPFCTGGSVGAERLGEKLYRGPLKLPEIQRQILQIQNPFGNILGFESTL